MTIFSPATSLRRAWSGIAVVASLAAGLVPVAASSASAATAPASLSAHDDFDRAVAEGWGTADSGAQWAPNYQARSFSVAGGQGRIATSTPGATYQAHLAGQSRDVVVHADLAASTPQSGGGTYLSVTGRAAASGDGYKGKVRLLSDGSVNVAVVRVLGGVETNLKAVKVPQLTYAPGSPLHVVVGVTGTSGVQVAAKVWTGTTEPQQWTIRASDPLTDAAAGNGGVDVSAYLSGSSTSRSQVVTLDNLWTAPVTSLDQPVLQITSGPLEGEVTRKAAQQVAFVSVGAGDLQCRRDGAAWVSCVSPVSTEPTQDGTHTFQVRGVDPAGAVTATVGRSWVLDTTAPAVSWISGPAQGEVSASTTATLTIASDEAASLACSVDGGPFAVCASPVSLTGLVDGSHSLAVEGTDGVGNVSPVLGRSWTVDTVAPETSITSGPADGSAQGATTVSYGFTANERATSQCRLDAADWSPCTSPSTYTVAPGTHTFWVRSMDVAGNRELVGAHRSLTVRASRPGATNTGVPVGTALTVINGDLTVATAGAVVSGVDVRGFVHLNAPNITFKNSIVRGRAIPSGTTATLITSTKGGALISDVELAPSVNQPGIDGVKGYGFTARRMNIHTMNDGVVIYGDASTVESSWIHGNLHYLVDPTMRNTPSHDDSIQVQGGRNTRITGNTLEGAYNAGLMITQDVSVTSNLSFTGNWADGGGCTVNMAEKGKGPMLGLAFTSNRFGHASRVVDCPIIGPSTTPFVADANVYDDTGLAIRVRRNGA